MSLHITRPRHISVLTIALILLFTFFKRGYTEPNGIKFQHITRKEGLSHSIVYSVIQDDRGFMWFGTQDGLNRYDGYRITVLKHDPSNPNSVASNNAGNIFKDSDGMIWIGTWGEGVDRFDPRTGEFTHFKNDHDNPNSMGGNRVQAIFEDSLGMLWFTTFRNGLTRYNRKTSTFTHYRHAPADPNSLSHPRARTIAEDRKGNIWIATNNGLNQLDHKTGAVTRYFNDAGNPSSISHNTVYKVYAGSSGTLWVGTSAGLDRYDPETDSFTRFQHDPGNPKSLSRGEVSTLFEDSSGILWIGMYSSGLNRFDPQTGEFRNFAHDPKNPRSLGGNDVRSIFEDRSGNIWLGTAGNGVDKFDTKAAKFNYARNDPFNADSLSHDEVVALWEDSSKVLWVGTRGGGVNRLHKKSNRFTQIKHDPSDPASLSSDLVSVIYEDSSGHIWIGTEDSGLNKLNRSQRIIARYRHEPDNPNSISDNHIVSIHEDGKGTLWFGTYQGGLNRFDSKKGIFTRYGYAPENPHGLSHDEVDSIFEDRQGNFWIGTADGLNLLDRAANRFTHYKHTPLNPGSISASWVQVIQEDSRGTLWIGTKEGGLNRFHRDTETFTHYTTRNGLPSDAVHGILEDGRGRLWLSTNNGICRVDPDRETCKNFSMEDGLQSNEFRPRSFYKNSEGEMFFGGIKGFIRFFPDQARDNPHLPPVVLTDFKKFGKSVTMDRPISYIEGIELSYRDKFLTFEFAGLEYTNPHKNHYAYKLLGFNEEWIHLGEERKAGYTNLHSGKYTFRVKASNNDGVWNEEGLSVAIRITPPPWKTWWAYGVYVLFTLGLFLGYLHHKTRAYKKEIASQEKLKKRLEEKVEERTVKLTEVNKHLKREVEERIQTEQILRQTTDALEGANQELQRLATVDGLTQIANRRRFDEYLMQEWQRSIRTDQPLSLILCDIDCFKLYNDTYGHQAGDECLRQVAAVFGTVAKRNTDLAARYGGEEFAVILPYTDENASLLLAQVLRRAVQGLSIPHSRSSVSEYVTISGGVASDRGSLLSSPESLITAADKALYAAKKQGRNRVVASKK